MRGSADGHRLGPQTQKHWKSGGHCTIERLGWALLDSSEARKSVLRVTSGERRVLRDREGTLLLALQCRQALLCQLRVTFASRHSVIRSSVARGICTRSGSGKVRHLSIKELWVQGAGSIAKERVQSASCGYAPEITGRTLGTKSLEKDRLDSLMLQVPLSCGEGERRQLAIAALTFLSASSHNENNEMW